MTFDWGENERKSIDWVTRKAEEIAKAMNPSRMNASRAARPLRHRALPEHAQHRRRASWARTRPRARSAMHLQSWDVSNVFVIGGSAFPQNGAYPPTQTTRHPRLLGGRQHQGNIPRSGRDPWPESGHGNALNQPSDELDLGDQLRWRRARRPSRSPPRMSRRPAVVTARRSRTRCANDA